ncbi:hypothetical protein EZM97_14300 [Dyella soli]|uniref:Alginate export domain-containing protein n=1 Tax=Dyella soli TaxID=522319 RepID=A0A4R0YMW2_9GAMM|nr:hypothetical protein EZM97_14300 [Dyella soli]
MSDPSMRVAASWLAINQPDVDELAAPWTQAKAIRPVGCEASAMQTTARSIGLPGVTHVSHRPMHTFATSAVKIADGSSTCHQPKSSGTSVGRSNTGSGTARLVFGASKPRDFSSLAGSTSAATAWTPRLGVRVDVAPGDRNLHDLSMETFNPLPPHGD